MMLIWGILAASLLGSVHCAAMCGAFACMASPQRPLGAARASSVWQDRAAYHAGRLCSYVALGSVAGALGGRVDRAGTLMGVAHLAAVVAGVLMVAWAAGTIGAQLGVRIPVSLAPDWARRGLGRVLMAARDRSPRMRAALIGFATTLLPCGWLYTFVVVAGSTGSWLLGANVMVVFWLGTIPMLVAVASGASRLLGPLARRMPFASAALVLVLGLLSIAGKFRAPMASHSHEPTHLSSIHGVAR